MLSSLNLQVSSPISGPLADTPRSPEIRPPTEKKRRIGRGQLDEENGLLQASSDEDDEVERVHENGHGGIYTSWFPSSDKSWSGWFYSACVAGGSISINLILIIFLLYAHTQPKCVIETQGNWNNDPHPSIPPLQELAVKQPVAVLSDAPIEQPPQVSLPEFKEFENTPAAPATTPVPTTQTETEHVAIEPTPVAPVTPAPAPEPEPTQTPAVEEPKQPEPEKPIQEPAPQSEQTQPAAPAVEASPPEQQQQPEPTKEPQPTPASAETEQKSESEPIPAATTVEPPVVVPTPAAAPAEVPAAAAASSSVDSFQASFEVTQDHIFTWNYCVKDFALDPQVDYKSSPMGAPPSKFCPETMTNEQLYQLSWFGSHVAIGYTLPQRFVPPFLDCIHLPPEGYQWPDKYPSLPEMNPLGAVHWPNLRATKHEDLVEFNRGTPKNLFHFDAPVYDQDGLAEMALLAKYVPLKDKVRNMFDIGAGGGSLGLLLKRKYDIQTIATAFADWPYCEYISERGELCLLLDVMEAMPFAKWSFDLIHVSWVYHGQNPTELWDFIHELDRLIRPGGYAYLRGGWSNTQIIAQRSMLAGLGYTLLYEFLSHKHSSLTAKVSFGPDLPYHADWTAIYAKPISSEPAEPQECKKQHDLEANGKVVLPLPTRSPGVHEGNVYEN